MKYSILRLITCLCVFTLVVPTVSEAWCNTCQNSHKDSCDDGYGSGGGSGSSGSNNDHSYGDAMTDMGMGAATVYGGIVAIAGGVGFMAAGKPAISFGAMAGGAAAVVSGANRFWNGMTQSYQTATGN